ncbi:beta/alpha barrel domain-containing protein [Natronorubrum texcoconense]|uniref:TIM-barrel protein, putative n=1 Tax=Natronorubrum texcoconense TaxID=1095776 RepID=A0A1G9EDE8_9EURY|nr:dihydropyrimidine dehydrogenase [Natronorubrum texcoconense]SDK74144.1 TIM-barrel protein, putative [Natronorubrum texcoconense]
MFAPPLALASLSGEADAQWARAGADYAGAAFLGGIALDDDSRAAARDLVARDRNEFLPEDPLAFVDEQLAALEDVPIQPAFNVRSATPGPIPDAARICRRHDAFLEINAHCRQDELCAVGCGETLLRDRERLRTYVERAAETGAIVGAKVRAEVPGVDLPALSRVLETAGASFVHVDAMDTESVVREVVEATDLFVIANNGVRDEATVREYADYGADAVSVGRSSDNPVVLERVRGAVDRHLGVESEVSASSQ